MLIFNRQNIYNLSVQRVLAMEWDQEVCEQNELQEEEAHEGALLQAEEDGA